MGKRSRRRERQFGQPSVSDAIYAVAAMAQEGGGPSYRELLLVLSAGGA